MKKIKNCRRLVGTVLTASCICALSFINSSNNTFAIDTPQNIGPNYTNSNYKLTPTQQQAYNEIDGISSHDADIMRYDKNARNAQQNYYKYEQQRYGTQENVINNQTQQATPQPQTTSPYKGSVDETGTSSVYINSIEVSPSQILSKEEINDVISKYIGRNVTISDIQSAIQSINKLYANKGFVTARAYLPDQTVSNGNIKIELIESKIGKVTVSNNKFTSSKYITQRIPDKSGQLFDIVSLEKDVLNFNRYHDGVNLTANLKAGETPGTTDIELTTKEAFPFHIIGMMDNAGKRQTGQIRGGPALVADSLFHHRDQMTVGTYFSRGAISPFFDYSYPINKKDGKIGFSYSSNHAKIVNADYNIYNGNSKTYQYNYSLYYDQPLIRKTTFELKSFASLNYKRSRTFYINDLSFLEDLDFGNTDQVTSFTVGANMRKDTKRGIWYLTQNFDIAVPVVDPDSNYFKMYGGFMRLHDFSHGWIGQLKGSYQVIPNNKHIPYIDQFQSGGLATVRGYSEGIAIGKNGYFFSGELICPLGPRTIATKDGKVHKFIGSYVKGAAFADTAGIFPYSGEDYYGSYFLTSVGLGLRVQLPGDLSARLYWGYPLVNNVYETHRHMGRFHFELTLEPDLDTLLAKRSTKPQPVAKPQKTAPQPLEPLPNNYDDIRHYDYMLDGTATSL